MLPTPSIPFTATNTIDLKGVFTMRCTIEQFMSFIMNNQLLFEVLGYEEVSPIVRITGQAPRPS